MKADNNFWRELKQQRGNMTKQQYRTIKGQAVAGPYYRRKKRSPKSHQEEERKMTTTTEIQLVDINKLVPYANNARTHNKEQILKLRSSLREFGFVNPVIIDKDYNVLAGHGRIMAAKEEGITEVPCVYADHLTEAQKKAYILADNRMALDAGWDDELLAVEMEELQNLGFDLGLTGFDEKEIADLFDTNGGDDVKDDDFDLTTALEKAAFVQRGDIWTVGRH